MRERFLVLTETGNWPSSEGDTRFHFPHLVLRNGVNTDEIYPADACLSFKDIGRFALTGDRLGLLQENEVLALSPAVLVGGEGFGCGSAREHAPISLKESGIKLLIARSFDLTFRQNCTTLGILTSTDLGLIGRLIAGEQIPAKEILAGYQGVEREIIERGGLFLYNLDRLEGKIKDREIQTRSRPMTVAEKIIARHLEDIYGRPVYVKPGNQAFVPLDLRASYEVFTPLIRELLATHAPGYSVENPESVFLVADHFIANVPQIGHPVHQLLAAQTQFAQEHGAYLYPNTSCQAEGIIHSLMIENHLLPGQLAVGTDSHSSMWGVAGVLALPVGASTMANAFLTKDTLVTVPESVKINLQGKLPEASSAKDLILKLAASLPPEKLQGKIIEFGVENLDWSVDELSVLTCMAKELGAFTAIMVPNEKVIQYLEEQRGLKRDQIETMIVKSDRDAEYAAEFSVNLEEIEPMVALPGSPSNSIPISQLPKVKITKAYIGSCVGGKWEDLVRAGRVLKGKKVAEGVQLIIQPASMKVLEMARKKGLIKTFQKAEALFLPPNCGACIGQGPGRVKKGEVAISASTRNYPGRMGEGEVYLASPAVVAASALAGEICHPGEI